MRKSRKTIITTEFEGIVEVCSTWDEKKANLLLSQGWILQHACVAHKDEGGFKAKPCWLLGRPGNVE